jgi:hypothetical protein
MPDGGGGGGSGGGGSAGGSTSPSAPKILTISTNVRTLHETEVLTVSAVVTDPDGIGDVIGGQLLTSDGTAAYGAFATDAGEGAYSLSLAWSTINATESIDTGVGMPASRTFRAKFFDAEGNSSYRDITVELACRNQVAACDGVCESGPTEYSTDQCGSCNHSCPLVSGGDVTCQMRTSDSAGICVLVTVTSQRVACATQCTGSYNICYGAFAKYGEEYVNGGCATAPAATNNMTAFESLECLCGDI